MLYDLREMELKGWHPRENLPQTAALLEQKLQSFSPIENFLFNIAKDGLLPYSSYCEAPNRTTTKALAEGAKQSPRGQFITEVALGMVVTRLGARSVRVGSRRGWEFPPLAEFRRKWEERLPGVAWEDDLTEWQRHPTWQQSSNVTGGGR